MNTRKKELQKEKGTIEREGSLSERNGRRGGGERERESFML